MHVRAVTYQGKNRIAVKKVDAPSIQDREDVIVRLHQQRFAARIYIYIKGISRFLSAM